MEQQYSVGGNAAHEYEPTDRIVISGVDNLALSLMHMKVQGKGVSDNPGATASYFVQDHVSLYASYSWTYFDHRNNFAPVHGGTMDNSVSIGLTYYINRGFMYK